METHRETLAAMLEKMAADLLLAVQGLRGNLEIPVAPASAIEQAKKGVCLVCNGEDQPPNRPLKRGQCVNCYAKTLRRIKAGSFTARQLIAAGKLLPPATGGKRDDDFPLDGLAANSAIIFAEEAAHQNAQQNAQQKKQRKPPKAKR